jgi:hypothetical protein
MMGNTGISMEFPRVTMNGIEAIAVKERKADLAFSFPFLE